MSVTITLPAGNIELQDASTAEDHAAHVQTHNINMDEIEKWIRSYKIAIAAIAAASGGTSSNTIETLIQSAKKSVTVPVNLVDGTSVTDANGFKIERIGIPSGGTTDSLEIRITDTDTDRNTNFENVIATVREFSGKIVHPTIILNLTSLRLIVAHKSELNTTPTHIGGAATDPNIKIITFI